MAICTFGLSQAQTSLEPFHKIHVSGNVELNLIPGSEDSYTAENNLGKLQVKVDDGQLRIALKLASDTWDEPTVVNLTYKNIDYIYASSGASVNQEEQMKSGDFTLFADTGARIVLDFNAKNITAQVGEGAMIKLEGETQVLKATSNTGGNFSGSQLKAETVFAKANTGGQTHVYASEVLEADASIGGMIYFDGNPEKQRINESLGGAVRG